MNTIRDFFHFIGAWKVWHAMFHDFIWTDWILFTACVVAFILGALKGFGFFFNKLIRALILIFAVMLIYAPLSDWAITHLTFARAGFWDPFFFFVIAALVILFLRKLMTLQASKGMPQFHPFWDGVTGALSGFFLVLLVSSFTVQFILLLPGKKMHKPFQKNESRYGAVIEKFVPQLVDGALMPVRALVNRKVAHS